MKVSEMKNDFFFCWLNLPNMLPLTFLLLPDKRSPSAPVTSLQQKAVSHFCIFLFPVGLPLNDPVLCPIIRRIGPPRIPETDGSGLELRCIKRLMSTLVFARKWRNCEISPLISVYLEFWVSAWFCSANQSRSDPLTAFTASLNQFQTRPDP